MTERQFWKYAADNAEQGVCISSNYARLNRHITTHQEDYIDDKMRKLVRRKGYGLYLMYAFPNFEVRRKYCLQQMKRCQAPSRKKKWLALAKVAQ